MDFNFCNSRDFVKLKRILRLTSSGNVGYRYAGPESQEVTETWARSFSQTYMVSHRDVIVASVDGRGTAFSGQIFETTF